MPKKAKPQKSSQPKPKADKPASKLEADLLAENQFAIAQALERIQASVSANGGREKKEIKSNGIDPDGIEIYHQRGEGTYWLPEVNEVTKAKEFNKYKPARLMDHFTYVGLTKAFYKNGLREVDWPLYKADRWNKVDYCGPLAGHRAGKFTDNQGQVFLVTKEARGIWDELPKQIVAPTFLMDVIDEGFQAPGEFEHTMHWMAKSLASLMRGDFRPGVALMIAGEGESGKSFFQWIVTQLFGGRIAKPWKYMIGEEKHNYDMVTAEHLVIADPPTTTDTRARRFFGNMIKDLCFEEEFRIRAMNKDALTAPLWHRLTITVNNETENLMVAPPMDNSLRDKLSMLKFSPVVEAFKPFDIAERQMAIKLDAGVELAGGDQDRSSIKATVLREMPHFRAILLRDWQDVPNAYDRTKIGICPTMRSRRTGLCAYQNPELLEAVTSMSPEVRLIALFDQVWTGQTRTAADLNVWTGRASDLEKFFRESEVNFQAERLLSRFENATGTYLGRAMRLYPERISREVRHGGVPYWTIKPPKDEPTEPEEKNGH